ncbi:MAG: ubiquinol-cytochrome c reductase iron-sulfur subunit [Methylacidiphilales bacterium]|nr:ubiquinol-cytochrome c reductase iron-sulfur subunit [Candidatus Methylacidiphilales bacterium]
MENLQTRRKFLLGTVATMGSVAVVGVAVPFISYLKPSAKAYVGAAPVEVDITGLEMGRMMRKLWKGRPIFIVHRSKEMLEQLSAHEDLLADSGSKNSTQPDKAEFKSKYRSLVPEFIVLLGVCTHLGCAPLYRPEIAPADLGTDWYGGFYCPCHGSKFDLSGRVYKGVPAQINLEIPEYSIQSNKLIIGKSA